MSHNTTSNTDKQLQEFSRLMVEISRNSCHRPERAILKEQLYRCYFNMSAELQKVLFNFLVELSLDAMPLFSSVRLSDTLKLLVQDDQ